MNKAPRPKSAAVGNYKKRLLASNAKNRNKYNDDVGSRFLHDPVLYDTIKFQKSSMHFHDT